MAPTYRTATQTRRGNRGAVEVHDDFEGLPVRQWRRTTINVLPPKPAPTVKQSDVWLYEQIHGMPKDWRQLPPHNQELVRAARAGYLNPKPEDDKGKDKKDKSASKLASMMFSSSKSVLVSGSIGRRHAVRTKGPGTSNDAAPAISGDVAVSGESQNNTPNPRKRSSPDGEGDAKVKESNKRQALEKKPDPVREEVTGKPRPSEPLSELDREIALAKARATANGEDVDIVVEYKFKVNDPSKARPMVRVISKNRNKLVEEDVETAQEKRERRKELFKNAKEGLQFEVWRAVPRSDEGSGLSYLAKRHKNTITLSSKAAETHTTGPTVTRAIVRRVDAAGNPYEQTVTLEEGQTITDGEIISTAVVPAPTAPELAPAQATPVKRRPPPPKRKGKGPGRGRKKGKLPILPSTRPALDGTAPTKTTDAAGAAPDATSTAKTPTHNGEGSTNQDTEMVDSPAVHSDEEDGDDGDDDDGEEGGEGDEGDNDEANESEIAQDQDQEMKDASISEETFQPVSIEEPDESSAASTSDEDPLMARSKPINPLNLVPPHLNSPRLEGSPLKNVVSVTPTNQSPIMSPSLQAASFTSKDTMDIDSTAEVASDTLPSQPPLDSADLPPVAPGSEAAAALQTGADEGASGIPTEADVAAVRDAVVDEVTDGSALEAPNAFMESVVTGEIAPPAKEPESEPLRVDEPLAPAVMEKASIPELEPAPAAAPGKEAELAPVPASEPELEAKTETVPTPAPEPEVEPAVLAPVPTPVVEEPSKTEAEPATTAAETAKADIEAPAPEPAVVKTTAELATEPAMEAAAPAPALEDEDDGMPDLLGGLERELDRQAAVDGGDEDSEGKGEAGKEAKEAMKQTEGEKGPGSS